MDSSQSRVPRPSPRPSPRRELQGPRPTPLKVSKDSHKIKKPHGAPAPSQPAAPPPQHRPPVIIYTVSPKVIHTKPSDFMALVQRLTGSGASTTDIPSSSDPTLGGAVSPAARLATFERAAKAADGERSRRRGLDHESDQLGIDGGAGLDRPSSLPGILSPVPSSLPSISRNFFSHAADPDIQSFTHGLIQHSPVFHGTNKSFVDNTFLFSPNNFLSSPAAPSPGAYWDLFNNYQGF